MKAILSNGTTISRAGTFRMTTVDHVREILLEPSKDSPKTTSRRIILSPTLHNMDGIIPTHVASRVKVMMEEHVESIVGLNSIEIRSDSIVATFFVDDGTHPPRYMTKVFRLERHHVTGLIVWPSNDGYLCAWIDAIGNAEGDDADFFARCAKYMGVKPRSCMIYQLEIRGGRDIYPSQLDGLPTHLFVLVKFDEQNDILPGVPTEFLRNWQQEGFCMPDATTPYAGLLQEIVASRIDWNGNRPPTVTTWCMCEEL